MIDRSHALPVTKQCQLLSLPRSTAYYQPKAVSGFDLKLMRRRDKLHLEVPCTGSRMLRDLLRLEGIKVGRRRVRRLMNLMGIQAIYRKPNTSKKHPAHPVYPYLLRELEITRPNHVWAADITYIPMRRGFLYLFAVQDWASRRVLSWRLSNTMAPTSVSRQLRRRSPALAHRRYSTPIRAASSPAWNLPACSSNTIFESVWTARDADVIMYMSSAYGEQSNMRRFICMHTTL